MSNVVVLLINTLSISSKWEVPFSDAVEIDWYLDDWEEFTARDGTKTPMEWVETVGDLQYSENSIYQAVEVPFDNQHLSFVVILPKDKETDSLDDLTQDELQTLLEKMDEQLVLLTLPEFSTSDTYLLPEILKSMGLLQAFSPIDARFDSMNDAPHTAENLLYITDVTQKVRLDLDRDRVEAAAVSSIAAVRTSAVDVDDLADWEIPDPIIVHTDHPFLYLIRENLTGSYLFVGRFNEPVPKKQDDSGKSRIDSLLDSLRAKKD